MFEIIEDSATARRGSVRWYRFQVRARRLFNSIPLRNQQKIFVLTLLIGGAGGTLAVLFHLTLDFLQNHLIYHYANLSDLGNIPWILAIPALGGLLAGAGLYFYAPDARGSGVPQTKTALFLNRGRIPVRVIWDKFLLASFNIGTGASLGREGPTVQICGAAASFLGRMFAIPRKDLKNLVPVGAAAGIAAAFNTPIAAVTFTMEEILGDTASKPLGSMVIAAVIASVIERWFLGEHPLFSVEPYRLHSAKELLFYAVLGVVAGFASVAFTKGLLRIRAFFRDQKKIPQWATPAMGGLLLGPLGLLGLLLAGSNSVFGVGYQQLSLALRGSVPLQALIVLGVLKLAATVLSYGSGSSGGIFGPALYIGGMLGGALGVITQLALGDPQIHPGAFALVGMGAAFAGIVRAPVTSIIIIFELTNNYSIILPLMIANIVSYLFASRFAPVPIYDALLLQDGIHLPHSGRELLRQITVRRTMTRKVVSIPGELSVEGAFHFVQSLPRHHHGYPVVTDNRLTGIVTFNDLKRALAEGKKDKTLSEISGKKLIFVYPDQTLEAVIARIGRGGISQLPVVSRKDSRKLIGIITMHDVAESLAKDSQLERPPQG